MASAIGSRRLTVLREFRPHGLAVEEADGEGAPGAPPPQDYDYFLFDPALAVSPNPDPSDEASSSGADGDHELFIRGNQIIWSNGSRVHKRYVSPNTVIMACWCRMNAISDALLCVLQVDTLSLYNITGEIVSIPLPYAVSSIWPLPFGLLLQKSTDGGHMVSSSSSLLNARDLNRPSKEYGLTYNVPFQANTLETDSKANGAIISSHLILKHPLEEPQATYVEEKDKLTMMRDFDEKTIWTSDVIPLIASYHKGKFQHSVWQIDGASYQEAMNENTMLPVDISSHKCAFRKIWQGKCSQSAASKVFLATDIDGMPIISFLLHEQKILLAVRIQVDDTTEEALGDIKPHMSWNIPAFAAVPVVVTRPSVGRARSAAAQRPRHCGLSKGRPPRGGSVALRCCGWRRSPPFTLSASEFLRSWCLLIPFSLAQVNAQIPIHLYTFFQISLDPYVVTFLSQNFISYLHP